MTHKIHPNQLNTSINPPQKEKNPLTTGLFENTMLSTSNPIVANPFDISKKLAGSDGPQPLDGGAGPFPSLSKGTLKTTSTLQNTVGTKNIPPLTMKKEYPKKVIFNRFKHLRADKTPSVLGATSHIDLSLGQDMPEVNRTIEQETDSRERSIARSKRQLSDLIQANDFDKFGTLTFDPKKHNAYDFNECLRKTNRFMANQKRLHGDFRYVLVAEPMKDLKVHFHVLLGGYTGKYHATNKRGTGKTERQCYKIDGWEKNYGFADMEDISDKEAVSNYVGKYLSKDIGNPLLVKGQKRYYASKNLSLPVKTYNESEETLLKSGKVDPNPTNVYENDFIIQKTYRKL